MLKRVRLKWNLRQQKKQLEQEKQVLTDRLIQTVRVYLREYRSPVPDTLLRTNDREVMQDIMGSLDRCEKNLKELERDLRK